MPFEKGLGGVEDEVLERGAERGELREGGILAVGRVIEVQVGEGTA